MPIHDAKGNVIPGTAAPTAPAAPTPTQVTVVEQLPPAITGVGEGLVLDGIGRVAAPAATETTSGGMSPVDKTTVDAVRSLGVGNATSLHGIAISTTPADRQILQLAAGVFAPKYPRQEIYASNHGVVDGADVTTPLRDAYTKSTTDGGSNGPIPIILDSVTSYIADEVFLDTLAGTVAAAGFMLAGQGGDVTGGGFKSRLIARIQPLSGSGFTCSATTSNPYIDPVAGNTSSYSGSSTITGLTPGSGSITDTVIGKFFRFPTASFSGHGWFLILERLSATSIIVERVNVYGDTITDGAVVGIWQIPHKNMVSARTRGWTIDGIEFGVDIANSDMLFYSIHGLLSWTQEPTQPNLTAGTIKRCFFSNFSDTGGTMQAALILGDRVGKTNFGSSAIVWPNDLENLKVSDSFFTGARLAAVWQPNITGQGKFQRFQDCFMLGGNRSIHSQTRNALLFYGGSFVIDGGGGGNFYSYEFSVQSPADQITIRGWDTENSRRGLYVGSAATPAGVTYSQSRVAINLLAGDGEWATFGRAGVLRLDNLCFDPQYSGTFKINVNLNTGPGLIASSVVTTSCTFPCPKEQVFLNSYGRLSWTSQGDSFVQSDSSIQNTLGFYISPIELPLDLSGATVIAGPLTNVTLSGDANVRAKNLVGVATIGGANTFRDVVFKNGAEADAYYGVAISSRVVRGSPGASALRSSISNKTTTGFRVTLEAAPGAGNVVEVEWILTAGLWTPTRDAVSRYWWDADQGFNGGTGAWTDIIASKVLTSFGASIPTQGTNVANGQPSIRFGGAAALHTAAFPGLLAQPRSIHIVFKLDAGGTQVVYDGLTNGNRLALYSNGSANWHLIGGNDIGAYAPYDPTNLHVYSIVFNGASTATYIDGVVDQGAINGGANSLDGLTLGARNDALFPITGDVCSFLFRDGADSAASVARIGNFFNDKYR